MRRALTAALAGTVLTAATLGLTGCAGSDEPATTAEETPASSTGNTSTSPTPDDGSSDSGADDSGTVVEVEIEGDSVEPQGKTVQVGMGEPLTLDVTSDRATELHVHSSPEQELEVDQGHSTLSLTLDTPGIVDVEEHESGVVILRLEVR